MAENTNTGNNEYLNTFANDMLYATTGVGISTGDEKDTVAEAAERVATQGFRDRDNNTVYDNNRRVQNIASVISLAMQDAYVNQDAELHKSIMNDPNNISGYISCGAFGNPNAFGNLQQAIFNGNFVDSNGVSKPVSEYLSQTQISSLVGTMNKSCFQSLETSGSFQINNIATSSLANILPQGTLTFQAAAGSHAQELAYVYNKQVDSIERFKNASSNRERAEAMREMRQGMTSHIRGLAPELASFDGTQKSFDKIMNDAKVPQSAKDLLQQQIAPIGISGDISKHQSRRRQGGNLVSSYFGGHDVKSGSNFWMQSYRTTRLVGNATAKAAFTTVRNASTFASKKIGKLADKTTSNTLANMSANAEKIATNFQKKKDDLSARERMNRKEKRADNRRRRAETKDRRIERENGRINRTKTRIENAQKSGNKELEKNLLKKQDKQLKAKNRHDSKRRKQGERTQKNRDRIAALKDKTLTMRNKMSNSKVGRFTSKWGGRIAKPFKKVGSVIAAPIKKITEVTNKLKKAIRNKIGAMLKAVIGFLAPPLATVTLVFVIFSVLGCFIILIAVFASSLVEKAGAWAHALENINYVQLIANDISENLEKEYLQVVQDDAVRYYSGVGEGSSKVPSNRLGWTAQITGATLGEFQDEYGNPMPGISNTMQIASLMHYHMMDELNYAQYYTAEAYCYSLWLQSHHIGGVGHADYELKLDNFECQELSGCGNVYYHDYDSNMSLTINQARSKASTVVTAWMETARSSVLSAFGDEDATTYEAAMKKALEGEHSTLKKDDFTDAVTIPAVAFTSNCPQEYAQMTRDCSSVKCEVQSNGSHIHYYPCDNYEASDSGLLLYDLKRGDEAPGCPGYEHTHGNGQCNGDNCSHECDESCCSLQHPHKGPCNSDDCSHVCGAECCSLQEHTHQEWKSENDNGCYATKFTCGGHCGGHATPVVNLWTETDWETLMYDDCLCVENTHWLNEDDFKISTGEKAGAAIWNFVTTGNGSISLSQWEGIWASKIRDWFRVIPTAKEAIIASGRFANAGVRALVGAVSSSGEVEPVEEASVDKDAYGFTGWFLEDGSINQSYLSDIKSLYGTKDDNFELGYQNWEEIGEVVFPVAGTMPVTAQTKAEIISILQSTYGLSDRECAIVSAAMDGCGKFIYSLQNPQEGHAESGLIDCSGFVASVLYHSGIGWDNPTWTASSFAQAGSANNGSLRPGDVVAKNANSYYNGTEWVGGDSNHVVVYLGYFEDGQCPYPGAEESGHYVIDCSSSEGGAKIRKMNGVLNYERVYRP